jgi:uncharacterized protein YjbJ (UPF0337 family)
MQFRCQLQLFPLSLSTVLQGTLPAGLLFHCLILRKEMPTRGFHQASELLRPILPGSGIWHPSCVDLAEKGISLSIVQRRSIMNWDQIQGNWKQFSGKVKEKWGKLTDDDLTVVAGKRDQLAGILQKKYGYAKDQAERELDEFSRNLNKV